MDSSAVEYRMDSGREAVIQFAITLRALGLLGDARAIEPLVEAMGDQETHVGWEAGMALGNIADPRASQAAVGALQSSSKHRRLYAALSLKQRKDPATIEPLKAALEDPDSDVSRTALEALASFKDPRLVDIFMRFAKNNYFFTVRQIAIRALADCKESKAIPLLIEALSDSTLQSYAISALIEITGQDYGQDVKKWQSWWKKQKK